MIQGCLVTAGCSYTEYCWSTWADMLGLHYAEHQAMGCSGIDNAGIARKVVSHTKPGDTVVIMWSSFDRWSRYKNNGKEFTWQHTGSVKTDKTFLVNYYHPIERFQTTMDYVQFVDLHSKQNSYSVYHFSAFPFMLGEIEKTVDPAIHSIYSQYTVDNNFLLEKSLDNYMIDNGQQIVTSHKYFENDTHPLPTTHWEYLNKVIAPKLSVDIDQNLYAKVAEETTKIVNRGELTPRHLLKV